MDEQQKPEIAINFLFNLIYLIVSLNTFHDVFYVLELLLFQILFKIFAWDFIYVYLRNTIFLLFIFFCFILFMCIHIYVYI